MKSVEDGDYDAIAIINECARDIRTITTKLNGKEMLDENEDSSNQNSDDYPKFFKSDNKLLMIGCSKKTNTEYEHRAPTIVLDQLITILLDGTENGEPIPPYKLIHLFDPEDGSEFPEYYARTVLRWLRTIGLITRIGHQGYSIKNHSSFESQVHAHWKRLATK